MKKPPRVGLVIEGKATSSPVLRSPAILAELGPIKAKTLRVARRVANFLNAGTPVERYEELEEAQVVLIHVPDHAMDSVIEDLDQALIGHHGRCYVLCETWSSSNRLSVLVQRGASAATCVSIATAGGRWFILEGAPAATRPLRRLLDNESDPVVTLKLGQKELLFAAELLAGVLPISLLGHAEEALRAANLSGRRLRSLLDGIAQRMLLDVAQPQHSAVRSSLRDCPRHVFQSHLKTLDRRWPELASYLRQQMASTDLTQVLPQSAKLEEDEQAVSVEVEGA